MASTGKSGYVSGKVSITALLSFAFGVVFLCVMLVFSVAFPNPSPIQLKVFITVLALAAGGAGALLPGFIEIQHKGLIRAGGAIALVVMVYFFSPSIERTIPTFVQPPTSPEPVAISFLEKVDSGNLKAAWDLLDPVAIGVSVDSFATLERINKAYREPFGAAVSRQLVGTSSAQSPPGVPVGLYEQLMFRTKFSKLAGCRQESVTLRATQDLQWRVFSFGIGPSDIPC